MTHPIALAMEQRAKKKAAEQAKLILRLRPTKLSTRNDRNRTWYEASPKSSRLTDNQRGGAVACAQPALRAHRSLLVYGHGKLRERCVLRTENSASSAAPRAGPLQTSIKDLAKHGPINRSYTCSRGRISAHPRRRALARPPLHRVRAAPDRRRQKGTRPGIRGLDHAAGKVIPAPRFQQIRALTTHAATSDDWVGGWMRCR